MNFFDQLYIELANSKSIDMAFGLNLLNAMKENLNVLPSRTNLDTLLTACLSMKDSNSAWLVWEEYKKTKLPYNILSYLRFVCLFVYLIFALIFYVVSHWFACDKWLQVYNSQDVPSPAGQWG